MKHLLILIFLTFMPTASYAEDHEQLFKKISLLAKKGDMEAAYHLGMFYNNGIATQKNIKEAYKWFSISGTANDPLGAYKLGCYFAGQAGDIVENDEEKALYYKLISANAGYSLAQYDVGLKYLKMEDIEKAFNFLTLAAKQGYAPALQVLASLNYQGIVIQKDVTKARAYILLSELVFSDKLSARGQAAMELIEPQMTKEEIKLSEKIIREWEINKTPLTIKAQKGLIRSYEHVGLMPP